MDMVAYEETGIINSFNVNELLSKLISSNVNINDYDSVIEFLSKECGVNKTQIAGSSNSYEIIQHPTTNKKYTIYSKNGLYILKNIFNIISLIYLNKNFIN